MIFRAFYSIESMQMIIIISYLPRVALFPTKQINSK
ncbi:hypothetical protein [Escherichia phage pEC-M2929-1AR.1]|nr:hypothetical protein [Escherichia phage pEC-M2929-1AR.1]